MLKHKILLTICMSLCIFNTASVEAGGIGKVFGKSVMKRILRNDLHRDQATIAKALSKPRTVFRYTSRERAKHKRLHSG
jgi:hypothetical protein